MRLVVTGSYKSPVLAPEFWQFGIRYRVSNSTAQDYGVLPTDVDWQAADDVRAETAWDIRNGFFAQMPLGVTFQPDDWLNDQVAPAVAAFFAQPNVVHDNARVDSLTVYAYTDSKVHQTLAGPAKCVLTWKPASRPDGAVTGVAMPPETATAVSLQTAVSGRRGRGRFYLPQNGAGSLSSDNDGSLKSTVTQAIANAAAQFLSGTTYTAPGGSVEVDPIVTGEPFSRYARVQGVRVGSVVDSQRRRRNSIPEVYASAVL
jgi:hypothetical protein